MLALSYAGCFLNLFNLIPLSPFDGGRITAIISPRIWFLGVPILIVLCVYSFSPMLVLIAILAAPQLVKAWHYDPLAPENAYYQQVSLEDKLSYGAIYLGLTAFLASMTYQLHAQLPSIS